MAFKHMLIHVTVFR